MCQPTYRLSNAIAPEGPCTGASADCPGLNGRARRPEVFRFRAVAHVRGIPAGPAGPIWSCTPAARSGRPDRISLAPGTRARAGPARPPGPPASRPGQRPELLRFADCGQATRRLRQPAAGAAGPGGRGRAPAERPRAASASGPRDRPAMPGSWKADPEFPDSGLPWRNCAIIVDQWPAKDCSDSRNAVPGHRGIRPAPYPDENGVAKPCPAISRHHRDAAGASNRPSSAASPGGTRAVSSVPSCPCRTASTSPSACARESRSPRS